MADRTQRSKGKANETAGKAKAKVGYDTGQPQDRGQGRRQGAQHGQEEDPLVAS